MSFDAITGIAQAEDAAKVAVSFAEAQARQMVADAEAAGREKIKAALEKADRELAQLRKKSEEKVSDNTVSLSGKTDSKKAVLRAAAEARLDRAAALVAERIVNG